MNPTQFTAITEAVTAVEQAIDAVTDALTDRNIAVQDAREHQDLVRVVIEGLGLDADEIGEAVLSALDY